MLNWQELAQPLQQIINTVFRFFKARRREEASLAIAALLFSAGYTVGGKLLPQLTNDTSQPAAGEKSAPTNATAVPATLEELVNPTAALCPEPHVIILDQFEQLRGRNPIFQLLRRVTRDARPPHRIT